MRYRTEDMGKMERKNMKNRRYVRGYLTIRKRYNRHTRRSECTEVEYSGKTGQLKERRKTSRENSENRDKRYIRESNSSGMRYNGNKRQTERNRGKMESEV